MLFRIRMLPFLGVCFALGGVGTIVLYHYFLTGLREKLSHLQNEILPWEGDFQIRGFRLEDLDLHRTMGFGLIGLQCDATMSETDQSVRITAQYLGWRWQGLPEGKLKTMVRNLRLASGSPAKPLLNNRYKMRQIEVHAMEYETHASLLDLKGSLRRVYHDFNDFLQRGETTAAMRLQGTVFFEVEIGDRAFQLQQRFRTRTSDGISRIVLNREDLEQVGPKFADRLSRGDLDLVANHPLKAPRLFEIRRLTEEQSRAIRWSGIDFPEDAYRHVLWSYLLTLEYGADFAQVVTNAHEFGSYNTPEEAAKDRWNNQIGIHYALEGVGQDNLLARMLSDPRIRR